MQISFNSQKVETVAEQKVVFEHEGRRTGTHII